MKPKFKVGDIVKPICSCCKDIKKLVIVELDNEYGDYKVDTTDRPNNYSYYKEKNLVLLNTHIIKKRLGIE